MVDEPEKQRTWIPAREALALVLPVYDDVASNAERALMEWAAMDQVVTRCAAHVRTWESGGRDLLSDDYLGPEFWDPILTPQSNRDWRAGNFSVGHYDSLGGSWTVRATGVLFCKDDLLALLPTAPETWLTARAALALLAPHYRNDNDAKAAIIDRASIGRIMARCETRQTDSATVNSGDGRTFAGPVHQESDYRVSPKFWETFKDPKSRAKTDWVAGDFETQAIEVGRTSGSFHYNYERLCGTKFRESDIRAMVTADDPAAPSLDVAPARLTQQEVDAAIVGIVARGPRIAPSDSLVAATSEGQKSNEPKTPVSGATLKAWWEMCKTINPSEQWDSDSMRAFFVQCFPAKSVSRDQLRDIRGKQKPGPKPKVAE